MLKSSLQKKSTPNRSDLEKEVNGLLFLSDAEKKKLLFVIKNIQEEGLSNIQKIINQAYKKQAKWFKRIEKGKSGFLYGLERKITLLTIRHKEEKNKKTNK